MAASPEEIHAVLTCPFDMPAIWGHYTADGELSYVGISGGTRDWLQFVCIGLVGSGMDPRMPLHTFPQMPLKTIGDGVFAGSLTEQSFAELWTAMEGMNT